MAQTFLMIVLTVLNDGGFSAAFSSARDQAACEKSKTAVARILTKGEYEIAKIGCYQNSQSFSRYRHGAPDDAPRHAYMIKFGEKTASISAAADLASCQSAFEAENMATSGSVYCATSIQTLQN